MKAIQSVHKLGVVLAIVLVTASLCGGQTTFQTGDVFVAIGSLSATDTGKVLRYRNDGTPLGTPLDTGQTNTETAGMAFDASGNLYAAVFQANNIVKFDRSGHLLGTFGSGYNQDPESIVVDSAGNFYVGQADGTHNVLKFNSSGTPLATFSPPTESRGTDWTDLAADQKTLFYTSEGTRVKRFDLSTSTPLTDFNSTPLPGPKAYALRILPNNEVLVADKDRVVLLDSLGNVSQTYCARQIADVCSSSFSLESDNTNPVIFGLTLDPDGKSFWTADLVAGTVWKVDIATGTIRVTINTGSNEVGGVLVFGEPTQSQQSVSLTFSPGTNSQTANFFTNGDPNDAASHAMSLTVTSALKSFDVVLTAHYVPTEFSTGTPGPGIADGICEGSHSPLNADDLDCGLAAGGFSYGPPSTGSPDQVVPHCSPYHSKMCVWYSVSTTARATDEGGSDYVGPVLEKMGWNRNVDLANPSSDGTPNPEYPPGWNNQNERLYDRRTPTSSNAFQFDVTDYYSVACDLSCAFLLPPPDQSGGGHTPHFNDFFWAAAPNPKPGNADGVEPIVPNVISPFPYLSGVPMLVSFELEKAGTETTDKSALTKPHSVNVGTLDPSGVPIAVKTFPGFPTTFRYDPFFKVYYIFLSPAPYLTDGTVYTLQIGSDLFPLPVTKTFVVKKFK